MESTAARTLEVCIRAWRVRRPFPSDVSGEDLADYHFSRGEFRAAVDIYATLAPTARIDAKRGWCLAILDRCEEAAQFLTKDNCGSSSAELATLASTIARGWNRGYLHGPPGVSKEEVKARHEEVRALVERALESEYPDRLAFYAYKDMLKWYDDREAALAVAERAVTQFSDPSFAEWHARLLRTLGRPEDRALDSMLRLIPDEPWPTYVEELIDSSLALSRYEDTSRALDLLEEKLRPARENRFETRMSLLRAYVDLRRALDADPGAAIRGLKVCASALQDLVGARAESDLILFVGKLQLALAVVANDESQIQAAVRAIVETIWHLDTEPEHSPGDEMLWAGDVPCIAEFGDGYRAPVVETALDPITGQRWKMLLALRELSQLENSLPTLRQFVIEQGLTLAPPWASSIVATQLMAPKKRDFRLVGRAVARACEHNARVYTHRPIRPALEYPELKAAEAAAFVDGVIEELGGMAEARSTALPLALKELGPPLTRAKAYSPLAKLADHVLSAAKDDRDALFYRAWAHQEAKNLNEARPLYERLIELEPKNSSAFWNVSLVYEHQGDVGALESLITTLEEHARSGEAVWAETLERARKALPNARQNQASANFQSFVESALSQYPALRAASTPVEDLSLLEAACLIALLRASDLDHSEWTLTPFGESNVPFEPTNRFRSSLLDLAKKGIIGFSKLTPLDAFVAKQGSLWFYLDRVRWITNPQTLALQARIRDMAKSDWPSNWVAHAETLARDLATEECVAYIEHLAEERKLTPPAQADSRAVFRELLEHSSVGKCWYYIYYGVQSANDYRTKYPVSSEKVTAMMLKKVRERGAIALEKGWDTSYKRIRALPRSHLSAALHDVLTGWGERAFEEPIRLLTLPDGGTTLH